MLRPLLRPSPQDFPSIVHRGCLLPQLVALGFEAPDGDDQVGHIVHDHHRRNRGYVPIDALHSDGRLVAASVTAKLPRR
ncbi:MAG TPA: hypothetical protein VH558_02180 [Pseudolabrys sp.]|jgi:hypothetical protein